jgi:hypothetical protein
MAIKLSFSDANTGLTFTDTYHRVSACSIDFEKKEAQIIVKIYKDSTVAAYDENHNTVGLPFKQVVVVCKGESYETYFYFSAINPDGKNLPERAYAFLMQQDPDSEDYTGNCPFDYKNDGLMI